MPSDHDTASQLSGLTLTNSNDSLVRDDVLNALRALYQHVLVPFLHDNGLDSASAGDVAALAFAGQYASPAFVDSRRADSGTAQSTGGP